MIFSGGYDTTTERLLAEIRKNPMLKGITLSGGDPFCAAGSYGGAGGGSA